MRRHADRLETLVYVAGKSERRSTRRPRQDHSADATVLDEGDTSDGTVPVPHYAAKPRTKREPTPRSSAELTGEVRSLLQKADRLVSERRLQEAGSVLKKAYLLNRNDHRIKKLLQVVAGQNAQVPARKRLENYQLLRRRM